ncbi:unnamed protein product, partial [Polarella glacialis]
VAVVLLRDINDGAEHARELANFLRPLSDSEGVSILLDLIPYNDVGIAGFERPLPETVLAFKEEVWASLRSLVVHVRHPRGEDSSAACGQLATATPAKRLGRHQCLT